MDSALKVDSSEVIGARLRSRRERRGWRQEDVAREMRQSLHSWERVTVAAVEAGDRGLAPTEQAALCGVFNRSWVDLLDLDDDEEVIILRNGLWKPSQIAVSTSSSASVTWDGFLESLRDGARLEWSAVGGPGRAQLKPDETDRKAARSLAVPPEVVRQVALAAWGHSLGEERDRRLVESPSNRTPRSLQALRGHVTRALMRELRDQIASAREEEQ